MINPTTACAGSPLRACISPIIGYFIKGLGLYWMGKKSFATLFATLILEIVFVDIINESCYPILDMAVEII
ncbi:MAG TPA: hypothetical protein DCM40_37330 [Maribacter sp.]|nr:hypothetical protein [Maribacter sp.]|tara:strand:+ start:695 stop:907 length:213 start_codon:yes stop_codon:yes gene_type:complete